MSLKENIEAINAYFRGIDYFNDALIVKVELPDKINVYEDDEKGIKVTRSDDGLFYYYGDKNKVEFEDIVSLIKETVAVYEDARKKAAMFKMKCEELKEIFATSSIDVLETLTFTFAEKKKERPKRKVNKVKKEENNEEQIVTVEENVV